MTAVALILFINPAPTSVVIPLLAQQSATTSTRQPASVPGIAIADGFRIDELLPDSTRLTERETAIFYGYLLAATPRERVAIAADYLEGRRMDAMTREQKVALQRQYDRFMPRLLVGSVDERAMHVNAMVQYYDQAVARYGPDQAMGQWLETVQDPNKLILAVSKMAVSPPTLQSLLAQVAVLGSGYVFDVTVGRSLRLQAAAALDDAGLYWTSSTKLAFGVARRAGANPEYTRTAPEVLFSFVRPELLALFKPDALLPRLLEGSRAQYEERRARVLRDRRRSADGAAIPTFDALLHGGIREADYLGLSKAFESLFQPAADTQKHLTRSQWEERIRDYDDAQMIFGAISGALSLDPKTRPMGRYLAQITGVAFDLGKAAAKRSAENGGAVATGNAVIIVIAAVVTMLQIMGDQQTANAEFQALAGMMSQLSAQIIALHDEMRASFHHVNLRLALLMSELQGVSNQLKNQQLIEQGTRSELRGRLDAIRSDLDDIYTKIDTIPDRVAIDALDAELRRCSGAKPSSADSDECGRALAAFLAQTARSTARQVMPMPGTTASARELKEWRRIFAHNDPASPDSRRYQAVSALIGMANAAAKAGAVSGDEVRAIANQPTVHPALIEHVINRFSEIGPLAPPVEKELRAQISTAVGSYEALHAHFEKNFDVYARDLLKRHEAYRQVYAKEVGRILAETVTRTAGGPEWNQLASAGIDAKSLAAIRADQAGAATRIEPCAAAEQQTYISPESLAAFAGTYAAPAAWRRILPLYRAAEALRVGYVAPICYVANGSWSVPVTVKFDELRANIHFEKAFSRYWRYAGDVQSDGVADFVAESFKTQFSPDDKCWKSCPAFANIEGRSHYKSPTPIPEAWSCAYTHDCRQGAKVQAQLDQAKLTLDDKNLDELRKVVAARLVKWRTQLMNVAASQIGAELRGEGTRLNNAVEGMTAFKNALEQLTWFVNERQTARVGPAAALGLNGWLLDEDLVNKGVQSGEQLAALLSLAITSDAVMSAEQRANRLGAAWLQDLGIQRNLRNVETVLTQPRSWVQLMDPRNVLNANPADDVATRAFQRDTNAAVDPPEFVGALRGKLLIVEAVRQALPSAGPN